MHSHFARCSNNLRLSRHKNNCSSLVTIMNRPTDRSCRVAGNVIFGIYVKKRRRKYSENVKNVEKFLKGVQLKCYRVAVPI